MDSTRRQLEHLADSLETALDEAEDERAQYHIRAAAQRVVVLQTMTVSATTAAVEGTLEPPNGNRAEDRTDGPTEDCG